MTIKVTELSNKSNEDISQLQNHMNDKLNKLASELSERLQDQGNELKRIKSKISEDLTAIETKLINKIEKNELNDNLQKPKNESEQVKLITKDENLNSTLSIPTRLRL
jgi:hypothetical protein